VRCLVKAEAVWKRLCIKGMLGEVLKGTVVCENLVVRRGI
jgi:hypothetical protein